MILNNQLTKKDIPILLNELFISSVLWMQIDESNQIYHFEVLVQENKKILKQLFSTFEFEKIKHWSIVDIAILLCEITNQFNLQVNYNQTDRYFMLSDKTSHL